MEAVLKKITKNRGLEAKWLNTLSLLEYIGARKIMKTVCLNHPSLQVLEHQADETRHAFAFKKLSNSLKSLDPVASPLDKKKFVDPEIDYLCRDEAVNYFQGLDHSVTNWLHTMKGETKGNLPKPYHNYLFVTSLIERRAMKLYPLYMKLSKNEMVRKELRQIIREENRHRHPIEKEVQPLLKYYGLTDFKKGFEIEENFFGVFLNVLKKTININPACADNMKIFISAANGAGWVNLNSGKVV